MYLEINREEAADLIYELVRMLETGKLYMEFALEESKNDEDVVYIYNREAL